ncbi:MAG: hypothetical protein FWF06_04785 [Symbiobacteriaceae bacterium]|nr:hypothetical protein [Symbiobacteriaceae bacterium]
MRPVDFHTNVARLAEAERALRQGERPAVQQTFAAEVAKTMAERERKVERRDETHAVQFEPRQRQRGQEKEKKETDDPKQKDPKKRKRLDIRI